MRKNKYENKFKIIYNSAVDELVKAKKNSDASMKGACFHRCAGYLFLAYMLEIITKDEYIEKAKALEWLLKSDSVEVDDHER